MRYQWFSKKGQLVAQTSDSSNSVIVWDKFQVFQGHRRNVPYIQIGAKRSKLRYGNVPKHRNAVKQALRYQDLLDSGQVDSQVELAHLTCTPRPTISAYLRLLGLDEEVRAEALSVSDEDPRVLALTETRLRRLLGLKSPQQRRAFEALLASTSPPKPSQL